MLLSGDTSPHISAELEPESSAQMTWLANGVHVLDIHCDVQVDVVCKEPESVRAFKAQVLCFSLLSHHLSQHNSGAIVTVFLAIHDCSIGAIVAAPNE
jgi:hypothetical protein